MSKLSETVQQPARQQREEDICQTCRSAPSVSTEHECETCDSGIRPPYPNNPELRTPTPLRHMSER